MKFVNYRKGFATNSSSTHSVIITNSVLPDVTFYSGEYGWETFVCSSEIECRKYILTSLLTSNIVREKTKNRFLSKESKNKIIDICLKIAGVEENQVMDILRNGDIYIDHQSFPDLDSNNEIYRLIERSFDLEPEEYTSLINSSKAKKILDILCKAKNIAILGGNDDSDNGQREKILADKGIVIFDTNILNFWIDNQKYRYDPENSAHVLFNTVTGTKIRITEKDTYEKAFYPELVDIKITNYCPFECSFCYQASTKKGSHASLENIEKYADILSKMNVFEVAIGGGEPTMHPNFVEILEIFRSRGIVPNFTTYSLGWTKDARTFEKILSLVGNIGISVHNLEDLKKYEKIVEKIQKFMDRNSRRNFYDFTSDKMPMVQHVVGTVSEMEFYNLVRTCIFKNYPILLLGYKNVGFGKNFSTVNMENYSMIFSLMFSEIRKMMKEKNVCNYYWTFPNYFNLTGRNREELVEYFDKELRKNNYDYENYSQFEVVEILNTMIYNEMKERNLVNMFHKEKSVNISISIDTAFSNIFRTLLGELKIPTFLYDTKEGKFSMYIDAVDNLVAPSSYIEKKDMIPVSNIEFDFLVNEWKKF
jgi:MoaA/NifB/PqqE/SkfB family radical SAM enzyme